MLEYLSYLLGVMIILANAKIYRLDNLYYQNIIRHTTDQNDICVNLFF